MDSKKLRIGNLILRNNKVIKVDFLTPYAIGYDNGNIGSNESLIDNFKPIPLNEEWLLKFGFEKNINYKIDVDEYYHLELMKLGCEFCVFHEKKHEEEFAHSFRRINSVDEIQNLYYFISGKELNLLQF